MDPNVQTSALEAPSALVQVNSTNVLQTAPFTTCLLKSKKRAPPSQLSSSDSTADGAATDRNSGRGDIPASYRDDDKGRIEIVDDGDLEAFLSTELSLRRLDEIYNSLWLTGLPRPPRPLHRQLSLDRSITITERMDMHLVWGYGRIFLKPLPPFLLDPVFWETELACRENCLCKNTTAGETKEGLSASSAGAGHVASPRGKESAASATSGVRERRRRSANAQRANAPQECQQKRHRKTSLGFLFTYTALISHESDFAIALEKRLLPQNGELPQWADWRKLVKEIVQPGIHDQVDRRFIYGELRLGRLNWIQRFNRVWIFRPYHTVWQNYTCYFRDNLGWLAAATVYIAVVLSAMQVGLGTDRLANNDAFQAASYGFSVFAILGPIGAACFLILALLFKVIRNCMFAVVSNREARRKHTAGAPV